MRYPKEVRQNPLFKASESLRRLLPLYQQFADDTSDDPELGLESDEVPDAYGITNNDLA